MSIGWFTIHWFYSTTIELDKSKIMNHYYPVEHIEATINERNETINILDWYEISHFSTLDRRKDFIEKIVNSFK
jgi:hypothetical protein